MNLLLRTAAVLLLAGMRPSSAKPDDSATRAFPRGWPGFHGPDRDNISREKVRLADRWPAAGPPVVWSIPLGEGYSGPAVQDGRVFVLDYDPDQKEEVLRCFSFSGGKEQWRLAYPVEIQRNHGYTRTVPAVSGAFVVSIGTLGHVTCADAATGVRRWSIDLVKDFGTKLPSWYPAQCPIIDGATVVLAPCGPGVLMMGVDLKSGAELWRTSNPDGLAMSHSSIVSMTLAERRMMVYAALGGIVAVSAGPRDAGEVLWTSKDWSKVPGNRAVARPPGGRAAVPDHGVRRGEPRAPDHARRRRLQGGDRVASNPPGGVGVGAANAGLFQSTAFRAPAGRRRRPE